MPRNLNSSLVTELGKAGVRPFYLVDIQLKSGWEHCWSGVGPLAWNGNTYSGLGGLAQISAIAESSSVQADGVTLTLNVAPSQVTVPDYPVTPPTAPRATVVGENIAWSFATWDSPYVINSGGPLIGATTSTLYNGSVSMNAGDPLGQNGYGIEWGGFRTPVRIPARARISGVYAVLECEGDGLSSGGYIDPAGAQHEFYVTGSGTFHSADIHSIGNLFAIYAQEQNTVPGPANLGVTISKVATAVYYMGSPATQTSLLYEALNDVRVGGTVRIWFGMLSAAGAIVGAPFLAYEGMVDEPTIDDDPASGIKIVLAVENRMRNHQRASGRRYTAADQKLDWPNDSGFNWVEILNEISLRWGS